MKIIRRSPFTGEFNEMDIDLTVEQYLAWVDGRTPNIQEAFPHLSDDEREFLISGATPEEWEKHMRDPEEVEGDGFQV